MRHSNCSGVSANGGGALVLVLSVARTAVELLSSLGDALIGGESVGVVVSATAAVSSVGCI